tara:strand:- start:1908 stop:2147 length:240 start_codon:yes stop_codon:yes gene_type:complete
MVIFFDTKRQRNIWLAVLGIILLIVGFESIFLIDNWDIYIGDILGDWHRTEAEGIPITLLGAMFWVIFGSTTLSFLNIG